MKIILAHKNTEITSIELDNENDLINHIVLHNNRDEKIIYFPTFKKLLGVLSMKRNIIVKGVKIVNQKPNVI